MTQLELGYLRSADELCGVAPAWNALWQRSDVNTPLARAECVAQWLEHFGRGGEFLALVVKRGEAFLAALPLVGPRSAWFHSRGGLPANHWSLCGDFLLDGADDEAAVCQLLAEGLNQAPWPLVCLAPVAYTARRWRLLAAATAGRGLMTLAVDCDGVGQVRLDGSWQNYLAGRSGNHRRYLQKARRRAERAGELSLEVHTQAPAAEIEALLRRGCEIEDRSWKGAAGTSILRSPRIFECYVEQAKRLAESRHLQLTFLRHCGRPIAFEYGCRAKRTYFSPKVGYDEAYARFSPGQLLRALLFERFFAAGELDLVDFWGPLSDATAKWTTDPYRVGKLWIAPRRPFSRLLLAGYAALRPARQWASQLRTNGAISTAL